MKGPFGVDSLECPTCGLRFTLVGDGLNSTLRCDHNQNPQRCRESPSSPVMCPQMQAIFESAVRARLQR